MSDPELEEALRQWLQTGPAGAPLNVVDQALEETTVVRQSRRMPRGPDIEKGSQVRNLALGALGVAALVLAVVIGVNLFGAPTIVPAAVSSGLGSAVPTLDPGQSIEPPSVAATGQPDLAQPLIVLADARQVIEAAGPVTVFTVSITNWRDYGRRLFDRTRDLPPCGDEPASARTWVDIRDASTNAYLGRFCQIRNPSRLGELRFSIPVGAPIPIAAYVELTDRESGFIARSTAVLLPQAGVATPDPISSPTFMSSPGTPEPTPPATPVPTPGPPGWTGPTQVSPNSYLEPSLVVDTEGHPHAAAVLDDGIWYVTERGGRWIRERLSTAMPLGQDRSPSIDIDPSDGSIWVAFTRFAAIDCQTSCSPAASDGIYLVNNVSGEWSDPVRVGSIGNESPSLAVSGGIVHVAAVRWVEPLGYTPFYVTDGSGAWTEQKFADKGGGVSLELAGDGHARIAFSNGPEHHFATAQSAAGDFVIEEANEGGFAFLALGPGDQPHVVSHLSVTEPVHATKVGDAWTDPAALPFHGQASGIVVDANGTATVLSRYYPGAEGMWLATSAGDSIQLYKPGGGGVVGSSAPGALALDGLGRPHVLFVVFNELEGNGLWYGAGPQP